MHPVLPSLLLGIAFPWLVACEAEAPPKATAEAVPNAYLERLQEAEAVKHTIEQRNLEQQRIDALIGRGQAAPPGR